MKGERISHSISDIVYYVSEQGNYRTTNEDKHDIVINLNGNNRNKSNVNFYGLYDGHGGSFVSKFLADNMSKCLTDKRVSYPPNIRFIKKIYTCVQEELRTKHNKYSSETGSTCVVVIHYKKNDNDYLCVMNTGDSRAIICRNNMGMPLTKDHKPNWPEEYIRILNLGGQIESDTPDYRICGLSVSRAFGDLNAEPYVTFMPDIFQYKLTKKDKFIVLGCDGLWDVVDNQECVNFVLNCCYDITSGVRIHKKLNIAAKLADYALQKGSSDNITIIVVFFD